MSETGLQKPKSCAGMKASYFSFGDDEATVTLPYIPSWLQQTHVMYSKLPMLHAPTGTITLFTAGLCQKLHFTPSDLEFDSSSNEFFLEYKSLHDPHLKNLYHQARTVRRLVKQGFITPELKVKCSLEDFNIYHQYLKKMRLNRLNQKHKRQMENDQEKKHKQEQKKKDRRDPSNRDKRGIAARERKQAKIKEEHRRLIGYLERDELKRIKLLSERRVKRGIEETKKSLAAEKRKQQIAVLAMQESKRKTTILQKRSEKEERSASSLREQRERRKMDRERKLSTHWAKQEKLRRKKMHEQTKKEERMKERNRTMVDKRKDAARRSLLRYQEGFLKIRDERARHSHERENRIERALSNKLKRVSDKFDRRHSPSSRAAGSPGTFPPISKGYLTRDTMWSVDDAIEAVTLAPADGVWKYDAEKAKAAAGSPSPHSPQPSMSLPPIIVTTDQIEAEEATTEDSLRPVTESIISMEYAPTMDAAPAPPTEEGITAAAAVGALEAALSGGDAFDEAAQNLVAGIFWEVAEENPEMVAEDETVAASDDLYLDLIAEYDRRNRREEEEPSSPIGKGVSIVARQLSSGSVYSRLSESDVIRLREGDSASPAVDINQAAERIVQQSILGALFYIRTTEGAQAKSSLSSLLVEGRSGTKGSSASSTAGPPADYTAISEKLAQMDSLSELMDHLPSSAAELRRSSATVTDTHDVPRKVDQTYSSLMSYSSRSTTEATSDGEEEEEEEEQEEVIGIVENEVIMKEKSSQDLISYPDLSEVYRENEDGSLLVEGGISAKALEVPGSSVTEAVLSIESLRQRESSSSSSLHLNKSATEEDAEGSGEATGVQYHSVIPIVNRKLITLSDKIISKHLSFISSKLEDASSRLPLAHQACGRNSFRNIFRPDLSYCERSIQYLKQTIEDNQGDLDLLDGAEDISDHPSKEKLITVEETEGVCYLPKEKTYQVTYESPASYHSVLDEEEREQAPKDRYASSSESQAVTKAKRKRRKRKRKRQPKQEEDGGSTDEAASLGVSEDDRTSSVTTLPEEALHGRITTKTTSSADDQTRPIPSGQSREAGLKQASSKSLTRRSSTNSVAAVLETIMTKVSSLFHVGSEGSSKSGKAAGESLEQGTKMELDSSAPEFAVEESVIIPEELVSLQAAPDVPTSTDLPPSKDLPPDVEPETKPDIIAQLSDTALPVAVKEPEILERDTSSSEEGATRYDSDRERGEKRDARSPVVYDTKVDQETTVVSEKESATMEETIVSSVKGEKQMTGVEDQQIEKEEHQKTVPSESKPKSSSSLRVALAHSAKMLTESPYKAGSGKLSKASTGSMLVDKKTSAKGGPSKKPSSTRHPPKKAYLVVESAKASPYNQPVNLSIADFRPRKPGKGSSKSSKSSSSSGAKKTSMTSQSQRKSTMGADKGPKGKGSSKSSVSRSQHKSASSIGSDKKSSTAVYSKTRSSSSTKAQRRSSSSIGTDKSTAEIVKEAGSTKESSIVQSAKVSAEKLYSGKSSRTSIKSEKKPFTTPSRKISTTAETKGTDLPGASQKSSLSLGSQKASSTSVGSSEKSSTSIGSKRKSVSGAGSKLSIVRADNITQEDLGAAKAEQASSTSLQSQKKSVSSVGSHRKSSSLVQVVDGLPDKKSRQGSSASLRPAKTSTASLASQRRSTSSVKWKKSLNHDTSSKSASRTSTRSKRDLASEVETAGKMPELATPASKEPAVDEEAASDHPSPDLVDVRPSREKAYSDHTSPSVSKKSLVDGSGKQETQTADVVGIADDQLPSDHPPESTEGRKSEPSSASKKSLTETGNAEQDDHVIMTGTGEDQEGPSDEFVKLIKGEAPFDEDIATAPNESQGKGRLDTEARKAETESAEGHANRLASGIEHPMEVVDGISTGDQADESCPVELPAVVDGSASGKSLIDEGIPDQEEAGAVLTGTVSCSLPETTTSGTGMGQDVDTEGDMGANEELEIVDKKVSLKDLVRAPSSFEVINISEVAALSETAPAELVSASRQMATSSSFEIIDASEVQAAPSVEDVEVVTLTKAMPPDTKILDEQVTVELKSKSSAEAVVVPETTSEENQVPVGSSKVSKDSIELPGETEVMDKSDEPVSSLISSEHGSPSKGASLATSRHASPIESKHASPVLSKDASPVSSRHSSQRLLTGALPVTSMHGALAVSKDASPKTSKHTSLEVSRHATPKGSKHASPRSSKHVSPMTSKHTSPLTSKHASPKVSEHVVRASTEDASMTGLTRDHSSKSSKHASLTTSSHASPQTSKHASPQTSIHASPQTSVHGSPKVSNHASPQTSVHASPQTSVHASPQTSVHASPKASKHASPLTSRHGSPTTSKHDSPLASKHTTPKVSRHGSPRSSRHASSVGSVHVTSVMSEHSTHGAPRASSRPASRHPSKESHRSEQASPVTSVHSRSSDVPLMPAPPAAVTSSSKPATPSASAHVTPVSSEHSSPSEHASPETSVHASPKVSRHTSPHVSVHVSPVASRPSIHASPKPSVHASPKPSVHASPKTSVHASPKHASPQTSVHASPQTSVHASPKTSVHASPRTSVHASPKTSVHASPKHASPKTSIHASPQTSVHASPKTSVHASPKTSVHASPKTSVHAPPKTSVHASPKPSVHASPRTSVHASPKTSVHASPKTSVYASPKHASPQTSVHASPQTSVHASPKTSVHASPKPSVHASLRTSVHASPRTSVHASPKTSVHASPKHASPQTSVHASPQTSVHASPKTSVHASPKTSVHASPKTSVLASPKTSVHASPKHDSPQTSVHASPQTSVHGSPQTSAYALPQTALHAPPLESGHALPKHASPRTSKHTSPQTSAHGSPKASNHSSLQISVDASPQTSAHASPHTSKHATPRTSVHASPQTSVHVSPKASKHASPQRSVHASGQTSQHTSPKASKHASPQISVHGSPQTSVHASPQISVHATPQASVHAPPQTSVHCTPRTSVHASPTPSKQASPVASELGSPVQSDNDAQSAGKAPLLVSSTHAPETRSSAMSSTVTEAAESSPPGQQGVVSSTHAPETGSSAMSSTVTEAAESSPPGQQGVVSSIMSFFKRRSMEKVEVPQRSASEGARLSQQDVTAQPTFDTPPELDPRNQQVTSQRPPSGRRASNHSQDRGNRESPTTSLASVTKDSSNQSLSSANSKHSASSRASRSSKRSQRSKRSKKSNRSSVYEVVDG